MKHLIILLTILTTQKSLAVVVYQKNVIIEGIYADSSNSISPLNCSVNEPISFQYKDTATLKASSIYELSATSPKVTLVSILNNGMGNLCMAVDLVKNSASYYNDGKVNALLKITELPHTKAQPYLVTLELYPIKGITPSLKFGERISKQQLDQIKYR